MRAEDVELQLAEPRSAAFTSPDWLFELKFDGFRLLAERIAGKARLVLRRGREASALFPEIVEALEALPGPDFIVDGELVIQDASGHPIFHRLLKRSTLAHRKDIVSAARLDPAVFFAFDLLMLDGHDTRGLPLRQRKELLFSLVPKVAEARVLPVEHVEAQGEALLAVVKEKRLEGVMAKRADAPYVGGRGDRWLKIALTSIADFAVTGFADDDGALSLSTWDGEHWLYAGKVGAGYNPKVAAGVRAELDANVVPAPVCLGDCPLDPEMKWVTPTLVVEVRYKSWPEGLSLREPVFLRFRPDKRPDECPTPDEKRLAGSAPVSEPATVAVSNPGKVYFPRDGITKGEVVAWYRDVAPFMLPYLKDRPLLVTRYPDGIDGKSFFQKAKPPRAPDFVRTVRTFSEEVNREVDQIVCDDVATLEWCANLGALPFHVPTTRASAPGRPDWCVVDFDPKDAPFEAVITLANSLRGLTERGGLPSYVKTSGSSGLHVLVPLGGQLDHDGARQLSEVLAQLLVARHPDLATLERSMPKRKGRVYLDVMQNGPVKVVAAPFCVRAKDGAPVSMPIPWSEVKAGLTPTRFTIRNGRAWLEANGDPMRAVLTDVPDLASALTKLV
ncbi:MAG: DNA ligase D [Myxococcaceae bacterium]|jgi:bifunctional non-homologous end joining protein LigD|nr:DNA ligase D [Myxococcaceae bacterium]